MARVLIVGANGQLGTDCVRAFQEAGHDTMGMTRDRVDLLDPAGLERALVESRPAVVVNAAAMSNVPGCEADPEQAYRVNALGPRSLARAVAAAGARLLHVSTDYVFDGAACRPYEEGDLPRPLNAYGNSKLSGEHFVLAHAGDAAIVRTSGLYGRAPCRGKGGRNFVQTVLEIARAQGEVKVVTDEVVTPTYTLDLARQLAILADAEVRGVVHATSDGECSWYEFARAIFELTGVPVDLVEVRAADFPSPVTRPPYSVLANARLRTAGLDRMPHWRTSLEAYLREIGEMPPAPGHI